MTYAHSVVVVTLCAARGDKFAQTVQRRRHLLPAAVRHHRRHPGQVAHTHLLPAAVRHHRRHPGQVVHAHLLPAAVRHHRHHPGQVVHTYRLCGIIIGVSMAFAEFCYKTSVEAMHRKACIPEPY